MDQLSNFVGVSYPDKLDILNSIGGRAYFHQTNPQKAVRYGLYDICSAYIIYSYFIQIVGNQSTL